MSRAAYRRAKAALRGEPLRAEEKKAQREFRREIVAAIRREVFARSAGRCEACSSPLYGRAVLDHWEGGTGRRRVRESIETCWALCLPCDRKRTLNKPHAEQWNVWRERHCQRYGYPFLPHIVHASLPRGAK
jgi:hypothetical protein